MTHVDIPARAAGSADASADGSSDAADPNGAGQGFAGEAAPEGKGKSHE